MRSFIEYINKKNNDECLDIQEKRQIMDDDARKIIKDHCKVDHAKDPQKLDKYKRNS